MARPIKETPILYGEDARKFEERMKNPPKETKEERERRLRHYNAVMQWFENGENYGKKSRTKHTETSEG